MPIVELTNQFITNELHCPPDKKRIEYCDNNVRGLYILVTKASPGRGIYYLRYKDKSGKTCHQRIGSTDDKTLEDARYQAKTLKREISDGRDPKAEEKSKQIILTLDDFFTNHYRPFASPRKRSILRDEQLFTRIKKEFGSLPMDQITMRQMQTFHTGLLEKEKLAPATCNHHVKLMKRMLGLAVSWGMLDVNPAARFPLFKEDNKVENYLNQEELGRLLKVLKTYPNRNVCHIALWLLSTGARLSEALKARWDQVDRENRLWRIPASNSKSRKVRSVPLNDSALDILKELDTEGEYEHLFVNRTTGKPFVEIHRVWVRIKTKAGLPHIRLHDLRHQYASMLVNSGRTLYEVQHLLGHASPIMSQRYAHLSTKTLQEAANSASDMIKGASKERA